MTFLVSEWQDIAVAVLIVAATLVVLVPLALWIERRRDR